MLHYRSVYIYKNINVYNAAQQHFRRLFIYIYISILWNTIFNWLTLFGGSYQIHHFFCIEREKNIASLQKPGKRSYLRYKLRTPHIWLDIKLILYWWKDDSLPWPLMIDHILLIFQNPPPLFFYQYWIISQNVDDV